MTPAQFKTERERQGFTQETVADMADLSLSTIRDFEEGRPVNASLVDAIRVTIESLGAVFSPAPDAG
jgi:transcriptional regulator with XRE-family HTH domain